MVMHSTALVLGNSGSLLEHPTQDRWPEALVIGTNRILRTAQDGRQYHPDWIVVSDGRVLASEREALLGYRGRLICADWLGTDLPCDRFRGVPMRSSLKDRPIPHFHENKWDDPVWSIGCVAFQAAQLALRVLAPGGRVILLGCEERWPPRGDPRRTKHHFYHDREIVKGNRPFQVNQSYHFQWGVLGRWARERGTEVLEASPWEDLRLRELTHTRFADLCRM